MGMSGCQSNCLEGWLPLGAAHSLRGCSGSGAGEESGKWGWRGVPIPCHGPWPMAPVLRWGGLHPFSISSELKVELCVRVLDQPLTAAPPPGIIRGGEQLEPPFKEIA